MQTRQPLASKSTNVQRSRSSSPLKRSDSPTKKTLFSTSPTKKQRYSPIKNQPNLKHPSTFTIYQDNSFNKKDYLKSLNSDSIIPNFNKFDISSNKENENLIVKSKNINLNIENIENNKLINKLNNKSTSKKRKPLSDLNINNYPGFITLGPLKPLSKIEQLNEPWSTNSFSSNSFSNRKRLLIPSYITPPKRNRIKHYKFISTCNDNTQYGNLLSKLKSHDDTYQPETIDAFYIHNDKIDSIK